MSILFLDDLKIEAFKFTSFNRSVLTYHKKQIIAKIIIEKPGSRCSESLLTAEYAALLM